MAKHDENDGGLRKVAALLLALEGEAAAMLLKQLGESDVQALTAEMARLGSLNGRDLDTALKSFSDAINADRVDANLATRRLVERAFGSDRGRDLIDRAGRGCALAHRHRQPERAQRRAERETHQPSADQQHVDLGVHAGTAERSGFGGRTHGVVHAASSSSTVWCWLV